MKVKSLGWRWRRIFSAFLRVSSIITHASATLSLLSRIQPKGSAEMFFVVATTGAPPSN